jgi:hypothetical protein
MEVAGPELYHRGKVITSDEWKILRLVEHWQFFVTPTFVDLGTPSGRIQRLNNWLRWVAHEGNTTKRYLIYVVRWERGELGDRPHCHLFLGGMKAIKNPLSMCGILAHGWQQRYRSRIQVRVFERTDIKRSASYIGGDSSSVDWGKNRYEISKFRSADKVHFSLRAEELLQKMS